MEAINTGATLFQKIVLSVGFISAVIYLVHMIDKDILRNRGNKHDEY